jgi:molybdate transport system ATP-binding protein
VDGAARPALDRPGVNSPAGIQASQLRVEAQVRLGSFELATDLDLPLSGLTAVYGRSGSGKTTLINLVAGLLRPRTGRIAVGDVVYFDSALGLELPVEKRGLGYVFQDARLFPHLSVRGNLLFGLKRAAGHAGGPRAISVEQVVELLGIAALLDRRPYTLSGGEKQRVALGRALLAQPRLLLMDEPLASLDAPRKAEILPYIERLRDELQIPILYVSHAIDEVLRLATAIVVLDSGHVVAAGRLNEVLQQPEVRVQLGGTDFGTLAFGTVAAHDDAYGLSTIDCDGFELKVPRVPLAVGTEVRARIPAREVALALARPGDVSITNRIPGVVAAVEPRDQTYSDVSVRLSPTTVLGVTITRESAARLALEPGLRVWCLIKSVALDAGALAIARGAAAKRASAAANDALLNGPEPPPR